MIDGSQGEGGGQILRTASTLSLVTGTAFRIENVRAGRAKPGLLRQHLTAVQAATAVGDALVDGAELGSKDVVFRPAVSSLRARTSSRSGRREREPRATDGAGPALLTARGSDDPGPRRRHPQSVGPAIRLPRAGVSAAAHADGCLPSGPCSDRHGFYPAGGGQFTVDITPCEPPQPADAARARRDKAAPCRGDRRESVRPRIGHREINVAVAENGLSADETEVIVIQADEREETDQHAQRYSGPPGTS